MKSTSKILWVDDEPPQIIDKVYYLRDSGFIVNVSPSIKEAINFLKQTNYDLIIVDVLIAHNEIIEEIEINNVFDNGINFARWIKHNFPDTPIIGCSVRFDNEVKEWFRNFGSGFWAKHEIQANKNLIFLVNEVLSGQPPKPKIFIIHGQDNQTKLDLKNYLQNTLKLGEPIILHELPSFGRSIIEKFEDVTFDVDIVFVLLTPDDVGKKSSKNNIIKRRARQNVIFEMGYFYGKLKRKSGRIILLFKGELELPSDISGVIFINIDNGLDSASEEIRRELVGYL